MDVVPEVALFNKRYSYLWFYGFLERNRFDLIIKELMNFLIITKKKFWYKSLEKKKVLIDEWIFYL